MEFKVSKKNHWYPSKDTDKSGLFTFIGWQRLAKLLEETSVRKDTEEIVELHITERGIDIKIDNKA
jgi:hypothetical protein